MYLPKSSSSVYVTVQRTDRSHQFAISAVSKMIGANDNNNQYVAANISSGLVWETCEAPEQALNQDNGLISNRWVSAVGSTYIVVAWKLDCSDIHKINNGFVVQYCPVSDDLECKGESFLKLSARTYRNVSA